MEQNQTQEAQRAPNGRLLAPLPGAAPPITSDTARDMVKRRMEIYGNKSRKRVAEIIGKMDPTVKTAGDAYAAIMAKQAETLFNAKDPKLSDVEKLGRLLVHGPVSEQARREDGASPPGAVTMTPAALLEVVRLIEADKDKASAVDGVING